MLFKLLHTKQLNTAHQTDTSSRSRSIFSSNSWWEMCSSGNRTRSVRPGGKYRSIQHTKISEIQTGIFWSNGTRPRNSSIWHSSAAIVIFMTLYVKIRELSLAYCQAFPSSIIAVDVLDHQSLYNRFQTPIFFFNHNNRQS